MAGLLGGRSPVSGGAAFQHIENINLASFHLTGYQDSIEQLSSTADEGFPLPVFVGSWCFAQDAQAGLGIAHAKDRLGSGLGQFSTLNALAYFPAQRLQRGSRGSRQGLYWLRFVGSAGTWSRDCGSCSRVGRLWLNRWSFSSVQACSRFWSRAVRQLHDPGRLQAFQLLGYCSIDPNRLVFSGYRMILWTIGHGSCVPIQEGVDGRNLKIPDRGTSFRNITIQCTD